MNPLATPENVAALDRAAELISDPEKWCRATAARNIAGHAVLQWDKTAVQWCAAAAATHCGFGNSWFYLDDAANRLYCKGGLMEVNDELGRIPAKHCIEALAAELRSQLP